MATTSVQYTGDGSTVLYSFPFPYIEETDVKAAIDGVVTTAFTIENTNTVRFDSAPALGADVSIFRRTDTEDLPYVFYPGSAIKAKDLNQDFSQILYVAQELQDSTIDNETGGEINGDVIFNGDVIINQEPVNDNDAVNKLYVDTQDLLVKKYVDDQPDCHVGPAAPPNPVTGDLWVKTSDGVMYVYANITWHPISNSGGGTPPDGGGGGTTINSVAPIEHETDGFTQETTVKFRINSLSYLR